MNSEQEKLMGKVHAVINATQLQMIAEKDLVRATQLVEKLSKELSQSVQGKAGDNQRIMDLEGGQVWRHTDGDEYLLTRASKEMTLHGLEDGNIWSSAPGEPFAGSREEFTYVGMFKDWYTRENTPR